MRAVFGHQGHEGLQGFVPKRGACPPLINSDYIDYLCNDARIYIPKQLEVQFDNLALAMLACLPSLVCSETSTGAQPRNEPPSKGKKLKKKDDKNVF